MLKQTTVIGSIMIASFGAMPTASVAADIAAGKAKASVTCAMCHGPVGQSMQPNVPNLSGQPEVYTVEQLRHYRSGKRSHEVMSLMAKPLTDSEIDNLAAWYASLKVDVSEK
jgi:cytochrome c553